MNDGRFISHDDTTTPRFYFSHNQFFVSLCRRVKWMNSFEHLLNFKQLKPIKPLSNDYK